jgi:hypothetical protein
MANNKPSVPWADSDAKRVLEERLESGEIPLDSDLMAPRDVYYQDPSFSDYPYKQFRDRLRDLRKKVKSLEYLTNFDAAALSHDRKIHPKKQKNSKGEHRWEGSEAERLLKRDIDNKKHEDLAPRDLRKTQKAYQDYPLEVFRKHIHQEVARRKFIAYCKKKAEKKNNS